MNTDKSASFIFPSNSDEILTHQSATLSAPLVESGLGGTFTLLYPLIYSTKLGNNGSRQEV